jgi:hypothetical protein
MAFAALKLVRRKSERESIGSFVRCSQRTNAAMIAAPTSSGTITAALPHTFVSVRTIAQVIENRPAVASRSPTTSSRGWPP